MHRFRIHSWRFAIAGVAILGGTAWPGAVKAFDDPGTVQNVVPESVSFAFAGIRSTHDRLVSGRFRAVDTRSVSTLDGDDITTEEVWSMDCEFDRLQELQRFDTVQTGGSLKGFGVQFLFRDGRCTLRDMGRSGHSIYRAEECPELITRPFEIRQLGLGNIFAFEQRTSFERLCRAFETTYRFIEEVRNDDGTIDLKFDLASARLKFLLRLDSKSGFLPVLLEERFRSSGDLLAVTEMSWISRNGAWAPRLMKGIYNDPHEARRREIRFEWERVNEPVTMARFTLEDMGIVKGDHEVDNTADPKNPIVRRFGMNEGATVREQVEIDSPAVRTSGWISRWTIVLANAVVAVVAAAIWFLRRRKRHSQSP
jgi:hypothetical protein